MLNYQQLLYVYNILGNVIFVKGILKKKHRINRKIMAENYETSDGSDSDNNSENQSGSGIFNMSHHQLDDSRMNDALSLANATNQSPSGVNFRRMLLNYNHLTKLPKNLRKYLNIRVLDISNNQLRRFPENLFTVCPHLKSFIAKNNYLTDASLPKEFVNVGQNSLVRELNLSGNRFQQFPVQLFAFTHLKYLYLGGNRIVSLPRDIYKFQNLHVLSMGGNCLTEVPPTVGQLISLQALVLCTNQIEALPTTIANLHNLKSLQLHNNRLKTLPPQIIRLKYLSELSLRENPLVAGFVCSMQNHPATLLELSARCIKLFHVESVLRVGELPATLMAYLDSAHHCVNPRCKGVYFDNRVEHVKFVDFCGKYRIPLLQYLCSSKCANENTGDEDLSSRSYLMKKVLLG